MDRQTLLARIDHEYELALNTGEPPTTLALGDRYLAMLGLGADGGRLPLPTHRVSLLVVRHPDVGDWFQLG